MTTTADLTGAAAALPAAVTTSAVDPSSEVGGSLSPSRAADFISCPLLYRFRTIDRLPEPPSPQATRGTVVHAALERLFDLPAPRRDPATARALVAPAWEELLAAEPELAALFADDADGSALRDWLTSAEALVERYFALEDPRRLEPAEREMYVETVLASGLRLRGYVDRLDEAPDGALRIVDYKSGRAPSEGFEAGAMFQLRFYALVLWRSSGRVPRMLQLLYLGSGEVLRYEPDVADLRATERKVEAVWLAIRRATETGDWRPRPGRMCDWCSHQALCPAFGGTPPPLPTPVGAALPDDDTDSDTDNADVPAPRVPSDDV
jgi:putative RecB family exonuclease